MDIPELIGQLDDDDQTVRMSAALALAQAGPRAVRPLISTLCGAGEDPSSRLPYRLSEGIVSVLQVIGEPAFVPLTEAIADAETWSQVVDLGGALTGLKVPDRPARYASLLRHPSGSVRDRVLLVYEDLGADTLRYLAEILPLFDDEYENVRGRAAMAVRAMGQEAVPVLRELRRSSAPVRRQALLALVELGGWQALDATDQALIRRLISTKIPYETAEPMHLCGHWYAVPTSDQAAVLDALGLTDATPVTMRLGEAAWHADHHSLDEGPGTWVYVTPVWDGWTLVFGHYHDGDDWQDALKALSRRFGEAHWYYLFEGCTGWAMAEAGEIVRFYDGEEPDEQVGAPHPAEKGYLLPHEDPYPDDAFDDIPRGDSEAFGERMRQLKVELGIPDEAWATDIAGHASVDPESVGPHTRVEGHGVLAITAMGRQVGTPRVPLPI